VYKERIRALYDQFSPGYRRIADYILDHYQDAAFMTAAEIARSVQVDTALVVRFAQRLGYPGFPELIGEVQEDVKQDLRAVYEPPDGDQAPIHMFRRNLLQDRNNLDYLLLHLDEETVQRVIDILSVASRIFVGGEGNAAYIAQAFAGRLLTLGYPAYNITFDLAGQAAISSGVRPDDVFVGVGMTAMTPGVAVMLKVARSLGAQTVGVVASMTHPIASAAELIVHAPVRTVGLMPSWTALSAVLHSLSQALAVCKGEPTLDWVLRTDYFIRTYADALRHQLVSARDSIAEYSATAEQKAIAETVN
jgi:DNA-binding MurR/RpiR family transcriptional regulator